MPHAGSCPSIVSTTVGREKQMAALRFGVVEPARHLELKLGIVEARLVLNLGRETLLERAFGDERRAARCVEMDRELLCDSAQVESLGQRDERDAGRPAA